MYKAVTREIEVSAEPFFLEDRSDPAQDHYVWAYRITIVNRSARSAKLVSRHWRITDGTGRVEEVVGPGVVGEQPSIDPGDSYQYTSGCPLPTSSGIMVGRYTMIDENGERFEVDIPAFSLDMPGTARTLN